MPAETAPRGRPSPSNDEPKVAIAASSEAVKTHAVTAPSSQSTTPTLQKDFSNGVRATLRVRERELPANEHRGRVIQFRESNKALVRVVSSDGPIDDGKFVRTSRVLALTQAAGSGAPTAGAPAWARKAGDQAPHWQPADVDALLSTKQLGPALDPAGVKVRVFAPAAKAVNLVLDETGEKFPAIPDRAGVWEADTAKAPDKLYGQRYHFEVDGVKVSDPYAQSTAGDYGPARFVNPKAYTWHDQQFRPPERQVVLTEAHVRDMTASPTAPVPETLRGTYGGLASSRVVDHYRELGVSGLELLPVQEYDDRSGDRGTMNHWGYMTTQYFAPERRYAVNGDHAPEEFKASVDAYHQKGISVIMDVVYNHTATGPELSFKALGANYYYRLMPDGRPANGAGTGNEFASEKPMAQKLIVDSLRHFVNEYHIDGFRFDLGSLLDVHTMRTVDRVLPSHVFLTSEPWAAEGDRAKWAKGDMLGSLADTRWSVWNDDYRNAVNSFVSGNAAGEEARKQVMTAVAGSAAPFGFALRPSQSVNYIESHDELTVADRVQGDKSRALLGAVLLLTSQGTPMLGHGQEFMRTKQGIANAHNLDNAVSHIDWSLKTKNADVFSVYKELISLRREQPQFTYDRPLTDKDIQWVLPTNGNTSGLGYLLPAPVPRAGELAKPDVLVLTNPDRHQSAWFKLPGEGEWKIVVHGTAVGADYRGAKTAKGWYEIQPGTAAVVTQTRAPAPARVPSAGHAGS
jgi:pullulanase